MKKKVDLVLYTDGIVELFSKIDSGKYTLHPSVDPESVSTYYEGTPNTVRCDVVKGVTRRNDLLSALTAGDMVEVSKSIGKGVVEKFKGKFVRYEKWTGELTLSWTNGEALIVRMDESVLGVHLPLEAVLHDDPELIIRERAVTTTEQMYLVRQKIDEDALFTTVFGELTVDEQNPGLGLLTVKLQLQSKKPYDRLIDCVHLAMTPYNYRQNAVMQYDDAEESQPMYAMQREAAAPSPSPAKKTNDGVLDVTPLPDSTMKFKTSDSVPLYLKEEGMQTIALKSVPVQCSFHEVIFIPPIDINRSMSYGNMNNNASDFETQRANQYIEIQFEDGKDDDGTPPGESALPPMDIRVNDVTTRVQGSRSGSSIDSVLTKLSTVTTKAPMLPNERYPFLLKKSATQVAEVSRKLLKREKIDNINKSENIWKETWEVEVTQVGTASSYVLVMAIDQHYSSVGWKTDSKFSIKHGRLLNLVMQGKSGNGYAVMKAKSNLQFVVELMYEERVITNAHNERVQRLPVPNQN